VIGYQIIHCLLEAARFKVRSIIRSNIFAIGWQSRPTAAWMLASSVSSRALHEVLRE
jgi:hypothetical protein